MKRLIKTVDLVFFCDDATGDYGLTHKETFDSNTGASFNAFWGGMGIFHDVFEHSHEYTNKYFKGDYAMNIGGEMAAMGSMWYYIDQLGMHTRLSYRNIYSPGDNMRLTTQDLITEAIQYGNIQYGHTLESNVPNQRTTDNHELEYQIEKFWKEIKTQNVDTKYEQEKDDAIQYKKSVSFKKIADLHRYGYRMAEKLVPDNYKNQRMTIDFFAFWDEFCKNNPAETMANVFKGMKVKLYKDSEGIVSWKATLINKERFAKDFKVTHSHNIEDEIYSLFPENY